MWQSRVKNAPTLIRVKGVSTCGSQILYSTQKGWAGILLYCTSAPLVLAGTRHKAQKTFWVDKIPLERPFAGPGSVGYHVSSRYSNPQFASVLTFLMC